METHLQPEYSIGLIGHVDHGKTTLVERLSGKWTDTHSEEKKRGITIRLGYADAIFYKCPKCKGSQSYTASKECPNCKSQCKILRKVSFIDAPGHETLMATMLSGAAIMDGALLLVSANEPCPQPQTREHLMALELIGVKGIIIVQNKIDLVEKEKAMENYAQIKEFIKGTIAENSPIIPVSAQHNININYLIEAIEEHFKTPKRDPKKDPLMFIARSFDINKPGKDFKDIVGGVLGGALKQGKLKIGGEIEISPGLRIEEKGKIIYESLKTKIVGIISGNEKFSEITPGGSLGVLTELDPTFVKSDSLAGNIAGLPGKLPPIYHQLKIKPKLIKRVVGVKEDLEVEPLKKDELLMINVNSAVTVGEIKNISKGITYINLRLPVLASKEDRFALSRKVGARWHLIGIGELA